MTRDEAIEKVGEIKTTMAAWLVDALIALDLLEVTTLPLGFDQISHRAGSETTKLILKELAAAGLTIVRREDMK